MIGGKALVLLEPIEAVFVLFPAASHLPSRDFDSKDLADMPMKLPASEVLRRFASLPREANKTELQRLFRECFCAAFLDVSEWLPPDLPECTLGRVPRLRGKCRKQFDYESLESCGAASHMWPDRTCTATPFCDHFITRFRVGTQHFLIG